MNDRLNALDVRLRDFRMEDIPALVEIFNRTWVDEPSTVAQEEHWERSYPKDNPRLRYAVETGAGRFIGLGNCMRPFWMDAPGVYTLDIVLAPEWRHRGIGQALLARLEPYARTQGAERIHTDCREDFDGSIRFLARAGFNRIGIRFESKLDLDAFDEALFAGAFERVAQAGYELTTLAAERAAGTADPDRKLYDLYSVTAADVPLPGNVRIQQSYDNWRSGMLESPTADPAGIFIAKSADRYVGMTSLDLLEEGPAITNMTGVASEHRGRGLALALKLLSFRYLKAQGYHETRTHNDTANPPILRLNKALGYQRLPGWLVWEKLISREPTTAAPD